MPIKMSFANKIAKYNVLEDGKNKRNFQKCLFCSREVLSLSLTPVELCEGYNRIYVFF